MLPSVAVVGATGAVGEVMRQVLEEHSFPLRSLKFLASERSTGKTITFKGKSYPIEPIRPEAFAGVDIVLSSTPAGVSRETSPMAAKAGAIVIDNSSAWRMDPDVPLVVPEVNPDALRKIPKGIVANPNCSTIQMPAVQAHAAQLAGNVLPHDWKPGEDGYTEEEWKMVHETRKIMGDNSLLVSATTARVAVRVGHSEAINLEFHNPISVEQARTALNRAPGVILLDDLSKGEVPLPLAATGRDEVFVGRIRRDPTVPHGLNIWVVADNLRKGAATNAVQIAEVLVERGWLPRR